VNKITDLHPLLIERAKELLTRCAIAKKDVLITETGRTNERQDFLHDKGRKTAGVPCRHNGVTYTIGSCSKHPLGLPVTWARGGESYHCYGLAFDFGIFLNGKYLTNADFDADKNGKAEYTEVGEIGESLGLEWGGRFPEKKCDPSHFQLTFGLSIKDLQAGKRITPEGKIA